MFISIVVYSSVWSHVEDGDEAEVLSSLTAVVANATLKILNHDETPSARGPQRMNPVDRTSKEPSRYLCGVYNMWSSVPPSTGGVLLCIHFTLLITQHPSWRNEESTPCQALPLASSLKTPTRRERLGMLRGALLGRWSYFSSGVQRGSSAMSTSLRCHGLSPRHALERS